jgi:TPR repeat protein
MPKKKNKNHQKPAVVPPAPPASGEVKAVASSLTSNPKKAEVCFNLANNYLKTDFKKAVELFLQAADLNYLKATLKLYVLIGTALDSFAPDPLDPTPLTLDTDQANLVLGFYQQIISRIQNHLTGKECYALIHENILQTPERHPVAIALLEQALLKEHLEARSTLIRLYLHRYRTNPAKEDMQKALNLLEESVAASETTAGITLFDLAELAYSNRIPNQSDLEKIARLLRNADKKNIPKAAEARNIFLSYKTLLKLKASKSKEDILGISFKGLDKAAKTSPEAMLQLGLCYYNGNDIPGNAKKAAECFRHGVEETDGAAEYMLALCYLEGDGVKKDIPVAVEWLEKSLKQGSIFAKCHLGVLYIVGEHIAQNGELGAQLLKEALNDENLRTSADSILSRANLEYHLGEYYCRSTTGVEINYTEAVQWYIKAANRDHFLAKYKLALLYLKGDQTTKEMVGEAIKPVKERAIAWIEEAAEKGHSPANVFLLHYYCKGTHAAPNTEMAQKYWRRIFASLGLSSEPTITAAATASDLKAETPESKTPPAPQSRLTSIETERLKNCQKTCRKAYLKLEEEFYALAASLKKCIDAKDKKLKFLLKSIQQRGAELGDIYYSVTTMTTATLVTHETELNHWQNIYNDLKAKVDIVVQKFAKQAILATTKKTPFPKSASESSYDSASSSTRESKTSSSSVVSREPDSETKIRFTDLLRMCDLIFAENGLASRWQQIIAIEARGESIDPIEKRRLEYAIKQGFVLITRGVSRLAGNSFYSKIGDTEAYSLRNAALHHLPLGPAFVQPLLDVMRTISSRVKQTEANNATVSSGDYLRPAMQAANNPLLAILTQMQLQSPLENVERVPMLKATLQIICGDIQHFLNNFDLNYQTSLLALRALLERYEADATELRRINFSAYRTIWQEYPIAQRLKPTVIRNIIKALRHDRAGGLNSSFETIRFLGEHISQSEQASLMPTISSFLDFPEVAVGRQIPIASTTTNTTATTAVANAPAKVTAKPTALRGLTNSRLAGYFNTKAKPLPTTTAMVTATTTTTAASSSNRTSTEVTVTNAPAKVAAKSAAGLVNSRLAGYFNTRAKPLPTATAMVSATTTAIASSSRTPPENSADSKNILGT